MGYDRYGRGDDRQRDAYGRQDQARWNRDDESGGRERGGHGDERYGRREQMSRGIDYGHGYGRGGEGGRDYYGGDRDIGRGGYGGGGSGQGAGYGRDDRDRPMGGRDGYGDRHPNDRGYSQRDFGGRGGASGDRGYGAQPQGYRYEDRGFLERAGDEVRSWFGDEDAERRRDQDARLDERFDTDRDRDYGHWRRGQIDALDRDYHEYRQENRGRFESEFTSWRTNRQTQRASLDSVKEHMDVVGSDGSHVGTVDKVRGDRIVLTRNDRDADGHHHSIPSSWLSKVDDKVMLSKTADEAKRAWRDEENRSAMGEGNTGSGGWSGSAGHSRSSASASGSGAGDAAASSGGESGRTDLNKSFSGTY